MGVLTQLRKSKSEIENQRSEIADLPVNPSAPTTATRIPVQPCPVCGCPILWLDIYTPAIAAAHCGQCDPPPDPSMVHSRIVVLENPAGFAWINYEAAKRESQSRLIQTLRDGPGASGERLAGGVVAGVVGVDGVTDARPDGSQLETWFESLPMVPMALMA